MIPFINQLNFNDIEEHLKIDLEFEAQKFVG